MLGILVIPLIPLYIFLLRKPKWYRLAHKIRRYNLRLVLILSGVRWKIINKDNLKIKQSCIFCSNHSSYLDVILFMAAIPGYYGFAGKAELLKNPVLKYFFSSIDVAVERSSTNQSSRAFLALSKALESGRSLVIFPEGGIHEKAPKLSKFKEGAFRLAVHHNTEIIPITFPDNWLILPDGKNEFKPGISRIIVHNPIQAGESEPEKLKLEVYNTINQSLDNALSSHPDYRNL
jgi:1-acyl-sn-glycerol-3-phosphate acyltransferase